MAKRKPVATGDCATCDFWKRKGSPIKGKLIPGGTGKCTRAEGLCENPKPKDPHPGWSGRPEKERGPSPQAPETTSPDSPKPGNEITYLLYTLIPSSRARFLIRPNWRSWRSPSRSRDSSSLWWWCGDSAPS